MYFDLLQNTFIFYKMKMCFISIRVSGYFFTAGNRMVNI
ncbi:hypothetical protein B4099_3392 [Heyndrickxia coagulans]|uniref:Uncharacterized protein n=1 Tax=Heyndrickxia coagulans TaxID=1398 RepID=A0A150JPZ3_HEYCO|nr:hypothetical protein B4099_3392 [Heyndrickxia coagulans]